jgi:hypothetical protein
MDKVKKKNTVTDYNAPSSETFRLHLEKNLFVLQEVLIVLTGVSGHWLTSGTPTFLLKE